MCDFDGFVADRLNELYGHHYSLLISLFVCPDPSDNYRWTSLCHQYCCMDCTSALSITKLVKRLSAGDIDTLLLDKTVLVIGKS